ncbi:MAG TPA: TonB-dependent receptor plug domain-containing protein [Novosphingobium sp.]|nr:TonB-dependent receptor plug domain-containing protein [Novosphingobium sp.]
MGQSVPAAVVWGAAWALATGPGLAGGAAAAPAGDVLAPEEARVILVTAAAAGKTAQDSALAVSQVDPQAIARFTPRSQAEALRLIPGLNLQDTAGPGGNANIGVRGIPVSTGGAEYVALQEDGLPVVLFGDMLFGNNDYWLRLDNNVARVEAVRGGSASTFASQAPGAVINYVSNTGERAGGGFSLSKALDYRETRIDADYGGPLGDHLRFHIGGYAITGGGPLHYGFAAEHGYQIKANLTRSFADGGGYVRISLKRLDDREPTDQNMPTIATLAGNTITGFANLPGIDARQFTPIGLYNASFPMLNGSGQLANVPAQGIHPVATALGAEVQRRLGAHLTFTNRFRWTAMKGQFAFFFSGVRATSTVAANGASLRYAAGPALGGTYAGALVNAGTYVNTSMDDMGSLANDLVLGGQASLGRLGLAVHLGWFHMRQKIAAHWAVANGYLSATSSANPVPLDLFAADGTQLAANGIADYVDHWGDNGAASQRHYRLAYTDDAPYGELAADIGRLSLDASLRVDLLRATGAVYQSARASGTLAVSDALGTALLPYALPSATPGTLLAYGRSYASWSAGGLYRLGAGTNLFMRASRGGRFNADRVAVNPLNFTAAGGLSAGGAAVAVNYVAQQEVGLKRAGGAGAFAYHLEATFFRAQVVEHNYDFTAPTRGLSPFVDALYHAHGLELSGEVRRGGFVLAGYVDYTVARDLARNLPAYALPRWNVLLAPAYDAGVAAAGFSLSGQSAFYIANQRVTAPGTFFVNAFVALRPRARVEIGLNANNLFNALGYRANNAGLGPPGEQGVLAGNQAIFNNSIVAGRSLTAALRYRF